MSFVSGNQLAFWSLVAAVGSCSIYFILSRRNPNRTVNLPYPPGPKGRPIIKNLLDIPTQKVWEVATKWGEEHGDIVHLSVGGIHMIFLNSYERSVDLLEKRSSLYSDRIHTAMFQLMEATRFLPLVRYGDDFRLNRRIMHQEFNAKSSLRYREVHTKYARLVLDFLLRNPESYREHLNFYAGGIIIEIVYGFQSESSNDPHIIRAQRGLDVVQAGSPGAFLVDAFPILKSVPDWMPGAGFKRKAKLWGKQALDSYRIPFQMIEKSFEEGTAPPSFTAYWLARISNNLDSESERAKYAYALEAVAGTAFLAGYETTTATLYQFIFTMMQYPAAQKKAQEELDRIVGRERLPEFSDKENLPYVLALYKEMLRWHPVVPLSIPHRSTKDDAYNGMTIPKDAMILSNAWAMSRNREEYGEDVEEFRPDRFLSGNPQDPSKYVFGFGRRICLGRYMVADTLFILICHVLHVFSIGKSKNEDGSEKLVEPQWEDSLTSRLLPFPCSITPRFAGVDKLVSVAS